MSDSKTSVWNKSAAKQPNTRARREMRGIAHNLQAVVTVAEKGLSDSVLKETARALKDHELIKVRINLVDKDIRTQIAEELAKKCGASVIQKIGKVLVLYKNNPKVDPKKSNITRFKLG
jgi:RNA-binding protein